MNKSHESYSKDFEASTKDVDLITFRSIESGANGCRLTGGGFGGFTVSLIEKDKYNDWYNKMLQFYNKDKFYKI
jgi:galactokinase